LLLIVIVVLRLSSLLIATSIVMKLSELKSPQRNILASALCKYGKEAGLRYVGDHIGFSYQEWLDSEAPAMMKMGSCKDKALGYVDALCVQPNITTDNLLQVLHASSFAAIVQDTSLAFLIVCMRCATRSLCRQWCWLIEPLVDWGFGCSGCRTNHWAAIKS
jgi:hypothetical protein